MIEVVQAATPATSFNVNGLTRYTCRYTGATGRYSVDTWYRDKSDARGRDSFAPSWAKGNSFRLTHGYHRGLLFGRCSAAKSDTRLESLGREQQTANLGKSDSGSHRFNSRIN
jgi:hypothetical protein